MALKLLKTTVSAGAGTEDYFFKGSATTYTGDIATATGISVAGTEEQGKVPHRLPDLLLSGALIRLAASVGTATNPKTIKLLCSIDKLPTVRAALIGKTLGSGTVKSVRVPRDAMVI